MTANSISKAAKPNPVLEPLSILTGEWVTTGKHPLLSNITVHGHASFDWLENGAFMIMHASIEEKEFVDGIAIFGSDDSIENYSMLYYDELGVLRLYTSTLEDNTWKWWRNDAEFAQHFTGEIKNNGNTIVFKGEMSRDGGEWEKDLEFTYPRIR